MKGEYKKLFEDYIHIRKSSISLNQFTYILKIYPSILVCMGDGKLDEEEWDGLIHISRGLTLLYLEQNSDSSQEKLESIFRLEFRYLLDNIIKWEKKFLNTLKHYLEEYPDDREFVQESMYLFANSADGISQKEQEKVDELTSRLSLNF